MNYCINQLLLTFLFLVSFSFSYSQLDSVSVDLQLRNYPKIQFGDTVNGVYFDAEIYTDDIAFFGKIDVNVFEIKIDEFEVETKTLINQIKLSKEELLEEEIENGESFHIPIYGIENNSDYEIRIFVKDIQGINYPMIKLLRSVN